MPRRSRSKLGFFLIAVLPVLALVGAFFAVDAGARSFAENRVEEEISSALPASVTGDVHATIGGGSVIFQFLSDRFERVTLDAPTITADGVPASIHVVATDVPVDRSKAIRNVSATVDFTGEALNALAHSAGTPDGVELKLAQDAVTYGGSVEMLGFPIEYLATAKPTIADGSLVLTPTDAKVITDAGGLDVSGIAKQALGDTPINFCLAKYIPADVDVTGVDVSPSRARLTLGSTSLKLTNKSLTTLGSCPAK